MEESGRAVLSHWRDLGAHANISKATWGPSLTKRMENAARMAGPIRALPADQQSKARLLKLNMLPRPFTESRPPSWRTLALAS